MVESTRTVIEYVLPASLDASRFIEAAWAQPGPESVVDGRSVFVLNHSPWPDDVYAFTIRVEPSDQRSSLVEVAEADVAMVVRAIEEAFAPRWAQSPSCDRHYNRPRASSYTEWYRNGSAFVAHIDVCAKATRALPFATKLEDFFNHLWPQGRAHAMYTYAFAHRST